MDRNIYEDIAQRTQGNIYIGVVGPVRTGKSTFIKRFMEEMVIPNIEEESKRQRAIDELPQSGAGRTIMTTEPKFIPEESVSVNLNSKTNLNVKMIDCVGYVVKDSLGYIEEGMERMVTTPWSSEEMSFVQAAETGTRKVIDEHSTIGLLVTTDGSICDIPRTSYIEAEEKVVSQLKAINKPFVILLNSISPTSAEVLKLKEDMILKYNSPVIAMNCATLNQTDISYVIETALNEFPVKEISFVMPEWIECLESEHWLYSSLVESVKETVSSEIKLRELDEICKKLSGRAYITESYPEKANMGKGTVNVRIAVEDGLFYKILGENSGFEITGQESLMSLMGSLSKIKEEYDKISSALEEVNRTGYGIVSPSVADMKLEQPEIIKQGGRYGIKLKASAPSIHIKRYKPKFLKTA
jgi:stage IV sporulation protein A